MPSLYISINIFTVVVLMRPLPSMNLDRMNLAALLYWQLEFIVFQDVTVSSIVIIYSLALLARGTPGFLILEHLKFF